LNALVRVERPAEGEPEGLLVLHHGRGADERDLVGLGDALDPRRRLLVVCPRAPMTIRGWPGYHWYLVERVGYPEPSSFRDARASLAELHDELWAQTGIGPERTVLGGFSMGAVMSYTLALDAGRPSPAGILALSGFVAQVQGWAPDLQARAGLPAYIAHGRRDAVIDVGFGRRAAELLSEGGLRVDYHESQVGHHVDPAQLPGASRWLSQTLAPGARADAGASD
jgi:phospholipase/carboxylesterase